ncbi:MAG: hypothetical protein AUK55_11265 [Syntrophobacteraceae bacterium CG2_30_61_12]|nr:MAG: hypothetical protein AUK55_11265 [Syntrophobacteraceae bacterium CG2_30_61_12]
MMGTLAAVLAKSAIRSHQEVYQAKVTGDIEDVAGVLKITRIHVHYDLHLAEDKRPQAQAAFQTYLTQCPAAQSVIGCIQITHQLELT